MLCCVLASAVLPAQAQTTLLGEFLLNSSLNNNVAGGPSLVSLGGTIGATGYVMAAGNQGLKFTSGTLSPTNFSIELSFKSNLDSPRSWIKLADFSGLILDAGLYIYANNSLQVYPEPAVSAGITSIAAMNVVLTRDQSGTVAVYLNGNPIFSYDDSIKKYAKVTSADNALNFFVDDSSTSQEAATGIVNYIRIYNGALTAGEVSALYSAGAPSAVPEPAATSLLLAAGALGGMLLRRRWGSKPDQVAA